MNGDGIKEEIVHDNGECSNEGEELSSDKDKEEINIKTEQNEMDCLNLINIDKKEENENKEEVLSIINQIYNDSCSDDDDDEDFEDDLESENYKLKKMKFLNEKKLAIKKLQINLRNEEAKLILLKRLYYSQKFPQASTNGNNNAATTNATSNSNVIVNKNSNVQQQQLLNKNSPNMRNQQQQQQQQQQRINSSQSQINHRSTDIMNRNKKVNIFFVLCVNKEI